MSVNVVVLNQTDDYVFYVGPQHDQVIPPGAELMVPIDDHQTQVLTFDRAASPSRWTTFGLGNGGFAYSIDPASGQSNFSLMMGPAVAGPQSTPPPAFEVSGAVSGAGQDDWIRGLNLILHGTDGSDIVVTITENP